MIKHKILSIFMLVGTLLSAVSAFSQVTVSVVPRQNPLPAQGAIYMTDPGRFFNISLTNTNGSELLPVRIEARIEGPIENGLNVWPSGESYLAIMAARTMPTYIPLQPGQTRVLTQTDLINMFRQYDAGTEMFGGGELYDMFQGGNENGTFGLLPEGHYGIKITAKSNYTETNDPGDVLGEGICYFDICYNANPPSFNNIQYLDDLSGNSDIIENSGYYTAYFPTDNPRFSWSEPTFNYKPLTITRQFIYDFRIYQLAVNQDPNDAIQHNGTIAYEQVGLMTPYCVVPYNVVAKLKRYTNVKYVAQVTARALVADASNPNYTIIGNGGKSEPVVLLMENNGLGGTNDDDIIVDNPDREYPINVEIEPKLTELTHAMESYFTTPGELFSITLENTSSENIPVCMLLQYYKGNWGVTAAPIRQHTNEFIEIKAGEKITLSDEDVNRLAGNYDFETDVIAFKAKTGFIIGKPTTEYFTERIDTAFLRVCKYTGGKPVLRETIIGKGRAPFTVSGNVVLGEMFNVSLDTKMPILPTKAGTYFKTPSRLFTLKIKSLAKQEMRIYPHMEYLTAADAVYSGIITKERLAANKYITIKPGETKEFSAEEIDKYLGGFKEYLKTVGEGEKETLTDSTLAIFDEAGGNMVRLSILDYDKLNMLNLEKDAPTQASLMQYSMSYPVSSSVSLGDVDITITSSQQPLPANGNVYINNPGRIFNITLKNLTGRDMKLVPILTYENRVIDGARYSYTASKSSTSPEFVLKARETKTLTQKELKQLCGDTIASRYNHSTGEKEDNFKNFNEIITTDDINHLKLTLCDADSIRAIAESEPDRLQRITVSEQAYDFYADKKVKLNDIDVTLKLKMTPMPYNTRAYFTKPEKLFDVSITNNTDEDRNIVPTATYKFNDDAFCEYLSGSYKDKEVPSIAIKSGETISLTEEQVHKFFAGKQFFKIRRDVNDKVTEREVYDVTKADKEISLDPERVTHLIVGAYDYKVRVAYEDKINDFLLGESNISFQISNMVRLDDVSVIVKPKMNPLPADADLYFNSPGTLFEIELKNNTLNEYNVIPNMMYLFDEFGSYYGSVYKDDRLEKPIKLAVNEVKKLTSQDINAICGKPDTIKCFEARLNGYVEKNVPDIKSILNLEAFNQLEVVVYNVDSLKSIPGNIENRKTRAMLGAGKSDFSAKNIKFSEVVVTVAPKAGATFKPEPEEYFEKPGSLFDVTLLNVTNEEQKVNLRLTFNDRYFINKPDSVITLKPEEKLKLSSSRLNNICGYDIFSYNAPVFECDSIGNIKKEQPRGIDIEFKKGENKVTGLVWRKLIEDKENPENFKTDTISRCDTIFQPALRDVWIGEYRLTLTDITKIEAKDKAQKDSTNECFKGKGYVHTTIMGIPARVTVEFDSIYINEKLQRVVKNGVRSITEKSAHVPLDIFKEEFVKELEESSKEEAEAKVDKFLKESNVGAFYTYVVGNAMQTINKIDSAGIVTLPLGLTVPLDKDLECPATIQLAKMEFNPTSANLDLIGEFVLPENDAPEKLGYSDILIFAARKLSTSPDKFLPESGSLGLVKDFTLKDPESEFMFTFKAPSNQDFEKATDGCYIAWENNKFKELCASISMNIPTEELIKDNGKDSIDPKVHPEITLTAYIADAEDWYATVKMDPFQVADAPGFTFSATGDSVGIIYDRSKRKTPTGIKFPEEYNYKTLGLSADPGKSEKAYNEWRGFYFENLSCKLPHFVELDDKGDSRVKFSVGNIIYDDSGFSMQASVDSLLNRGTPKLGGWRITLDKIYLNVKQGHFGDAGINGRVEIPLLYTNDSTKAQIGYLAKIQSIDHGNKKGLKMNFRAQQVQDSIYFDFMLAHVNFNKDKTYFNIQYNDSLPEKKRTLVELCLDGKVKITCSEKIGFELPDIPFENMRFANFPKNESKGKDKDKKSTEGQGVSSPDKNVNFHTGRWALAGDPGSDEGDFWGMPFVLENISMKIGDGAKHLGLYIEGGIVVMGNKKFGIGCTTGLTIWSEIDWEEMTVKYDSVQFNKLHIEGQYAGMLSVVGDLNVSEEKEKSGFDADLAVKLKGLFDIKLAGGYYKIEKTEKEFALDDEDEKKDKYYHAGYFLAHAGFGVGLPMGPVSLKSITGGIFINYSVAVSELTGASDYVKALEENLKPQYKSYGGTFGVGLVIGEETLVNGNANLLLMIDINKNGVRVPGFMFQGEVHALCASPNDDKGIVNAGVTILYEDTTTPDPDPNDKNAVTPTPEEKKNEHKLFRLSITLDADIAAMYKKITNEEFQVKAPLTDLQELDQKNADAENQGEKKSDKSDAGKAESKGYIKANCGVSINLELEVRNYPSRDKTYWHLYIGQPDESKRCRITFIDFEVGRKSPVGLWAKLYANAYLCIGNELPGNGQLPPIPERVQEALGMKGADGKVDASLKTKLDKAREQTMKGGPAGDINGGIMTGAAIGAEIGCNAVFCYADVEGMLGMDLVLKQYAEGVRCTDGSRAGGKNGFYASGQVYAMLKGELGLMLNLWIFSGKVPLVDMTLGALLQGGFPNPTWVYGRLRAKGEVLGGLIKFSSSIDMKAGKVCVPEMGNPLDDIKVFGDTQPGSEDIEKGWSEKSITSCYGKSTFTTNMKIDKILTLVDESATMELHGMGGEGNDVTRKYVFHLDNNFEMKEYDDSDPSNDDRSAITSYIAHINPTYDKENYELQTGSLESNTLYRIRLRGTCKEIVNGKEVDPIYKDSLSNYKEVHRPYEDIRYIYFRTGELSDNINDEVKGFLPNNTKFTCTLENATQPSFMEQHVRSDYWQNPDHEFVASVKVYDENRKMYVLPDAVQGLRKGQTSKFENLRVVEVVEQGIDEDGNEFKYATVMLEKPLPGEFFEKGKNYRFEIQRIDRAQLDNYINMVEENYKSIMAMTKEDMKQYEEQLDAIDEAIASGDAKAGDANTNQAIRDLYNYYKEVSATYGENEAEQRVNEYKEQLKSNTSGFAEVVYSQEYQYNGIETFHDYMALDRGDIMWDGFTNWGGKSYSTLYCKVKDVTINDKDYRYNNPYYALNFWHSHAAVCYDNTPSYDFCDRAYRECYADGLKGGVTFEPGYRWLRNGICDTGKMTDAEYEQLYSPKYNKKWYAFDEIKGNYAGNGYMVVQDILDAFYYDAHIAETFDKKIREAYSQKKRGKFDFTTEADNGTMIKAYWRTYAQKVDVDHARIPKWQVGLMYAADHPGKYGLRENTSGRLATCSYKYMSGEWPLFEANDFLKRISRVAVAIRFCDGYNIAKAKSSSGIKFGVRPSTSAMRTVIISTNIKNNEIISYKIENETKVLVADEALRSYLVKNYDKSKDGELQQNELDAITTLELDFNNIKVTRRNTSPNFGRGVGARNTYDTIYIKSLDALKNMPNLKVLRLRNGNNRRHADFLRNNTTLLFNGNPQLHTVVMDRWYVDSIDFRSNTALRTLKIDMRDYSQSTPDGRSRIDRNYVHSKGVKSIDLSQNHSLEILHVIDCNLNNIDLSNIANLQEVDLRMNHLGKIDLTESFRLQENDVNVGWQTSALLVGKAVGNYTYGVDVNVSRFGTSKDYAQRINQESSPNFKVKFIQEKYEHNYSANMDERLLKEIIRQADEAGANDYVEWAGNVVVFNADDCGIESIEYLDMLMPQLERLSVKNNKLKVLDLSGFSWLEEVNAENNNISKINVKSKNKITRLSVNNNELNSLPINLLTSIERLDCNSNNIEILYVNDCSRLSRLDCSNNNLTELALDKLSKLSVLDCSDNKFSAGTITFPVNARFTTFKAQRCLGDIKEVDLSNSNTLRTVNVSGNKALKSLTLPSGNGVLTSVYAADCALLTTNFIEGINNGNYKGIEEIDLSNNPELPVDIKYAPERCPQLKRLNVTGCDVKRVFLGNKTGSKITSLCVGVPQRKYGQKVAVQVLAGKWFESWDEWKDWPENIHTTYMVRVNNSSYQNYIIDWYDKSVATNLEQITKSDDAMRAAMGETFYKYMKDKYAPSNRILHTYHVKDLTELDCHNMDIVDLDGILKYLPAIKNVNASGNQLKTIDLRSMPKVESLDLSDNLELEKLAFAKTPATDVLNLSNSFVDDAILAAALSGAKNGKLIVDGDVGPALLKLGATVPKNVPQSISIKSRNRELFVDNCYANTLEFGGKSIEFRSARMNALLYTCKVETLRLMNREEPIELIFTTADMALMWVCKWVNDNPNRKFTMRIKSGNSSVDYKINNLLSLVNEQTKTGQLKNLTDDTKVMACHMILNYVHTGEISKGVLFSKVLTQFGLEDEFAALEKSSPSKAQSGYKVTLLSAGATKIKVVKVLMDVCGMGLQEAYDFCNQAPNADISMSEKAEAEDVKLVLENAGATVKITVDEEAIFNDKGYDFEVVLTAVGENKHGVVNAIRTTCSKMLTEANAICNNAPAAIDTVKSYAEALEIKEAVESAGGSIGINPVAEVSEQEKAVPNEDGTYNVILTSYGSSKLSVIKAVRDLLSVGLSEAKSICESLPYTLKSVKTYEEAENIKTVIVNAGGTVDIPNAPAQQQSGSRTVVLVSYGAKKLNVINALRSILGLSLIEAKNLCEKAPVTLKSEVTQKEAAEMKKAIEDAGGTVDISNAPAQQQSGSRKVVLVSYGAKKLNVINALRSILGLSLIEAKSLCEKAPVTLKSEVTQKEAAEMKKAIEDAGGTVELR